MEVEIETSDIIKLIAQFCEEHKLFDTLSILQDESRTPLDFVPSTETLTQAVTKGKWDAVLVCLAGRAIPNDLLIDLLEHIVHELVERGDKDSSSLLLKSSAPLMALKHSSPLDLVRYKRLESLANSDSPHAAIYRGDTRDNLRATLAKRLEASVVEVPPSRLLSLIRGGLLWEQHIAALPSNACRVDLMTGRVTGRLVEESHVTSIVKTICFPKGSFPESIIFTRDGAHLITGSSDGLVEIWNTDTGSLSMDFDYQVAGNFIVHASSVTALAISHDGSLLATGDKDGRICVWNLSTGKASKVFGSAHRDTVSSLDFSADDSNILSGSLDRCVKVHGIKSGRVIQEWSDHESFVARSVYATPSTVVSASSDGIIRFFSGASSQPTTKLSVSSILTRSGQVAGDILGVKDAVWLQKKNSLVVCPNGSVGFEVSFQGELLRLFDSGKDNESFVGVAVSPSESLIYFGSERGCVVGFSRESGELLHSIQVAQGEITCMRHHPKKSFLAVSSTNGSIYLLGR